MDFSKYENKLPWPDYKSNDELVKQQRLEYRHETARLYNLFKSDLLAEFDVTDNPKAEKAFVLAWERGHSAGYQEVYGEFENLVELIK